MTYTDRSCCAIDIYNVIVVREPAVLAYEYFAIKPLQSLQPYPSRLLLCLYSKKLVDNPLAIPSTARFEGYPDLLPVLLLMLAQVKPTFAASGS